MQAADPVIVDRHAANRSGPRALARPQDRIRRLQKRCCRCRRRGASRAHRRPRARRAARPRRDKRKTSGRTNRAGRWPDRRRPSPQRTFDFRRLDGSRAPLRSAVEKQRPRRRRGASGAGGPSSPCSTFVSPTKTQSIPGMSSAANGSGIRGGSCWYGAASRAAVRALRVRNARRAPRWREPADRSPAPRFALRRTSSIR